MIKKYKTEARPELKNEIWEQEINGQTYICERPAYKVKKFEVELLSQGFVNESKLIFGKVLDFYFDSEGRWWADPMLCSQKMLDFFIRKPTLYIKIITHKIQTVKKVISVLREVETDLNFEDIKKLLDNFKKLSACYVNFYSYHFVTYILYDELVLRFNSLLQKFLPKNESSVYLSEFLRAEITKEAIKVGAIGESLKYSRDLFYSDDAKPIIFYREPKLFFESVMDNNVIEKLYSSNPSQEIIQEFFALRLITPISIQISEEAQYIESKMLCPMMKIILDKIKVLLVKNGLLKDSFDVRNMTKKEIEDSLSKLL